MPKGLRGFQKGNKLGPGLGRPKKRSTIIREFIKAHPYAYDEMMEVLYNLGKDKTDKEAAQYICDRLKGRPHQSIDARVKGEIKLDPGKLMIEIEAIRRQFELEECPPEGVQSTESHLLEESNAIEQEEG